ncbi:MAG TPA: radical SAM protein [Nitrososphaerales archaeon]|nr:radical SAM protein [Nitrososphaerales archaeon]
MPQVPEVRELRCKTLLHTMRFGRTQLEYTANLYRGCTHGCVYCYAPSLIHDDRRWGTFVDAKVNAPAVLRRELRDAKRAPVFLSSASDPYQPVEARYRLTRRCLEEFYSFKFPLVILTRSPLVLRDVDLLGRMDWVRVGCSISTGSGRFYEPGVPPLERRLETLRALAKAGIETWVSFAPIIPGVREEEIEHLLAKMREAGVRAVTAGLLRFQGYDVSRENFERSTGMMAEEIPKTGQETMASVRAAISRLGFQPSERFFDWGGPPTTGSLDAYVMSAGPGCQVEEATSRSSLAPALLR